MTDIRKVPKTYLKFREDYPEIAKNYEALGESLAEIGALEKRTVALVKLEEGPMVTAQLADVEPEQVAVGMPVEMVTRKLRQDGERGVIVYGYKFRPVLSHP